MGEIYFTCYSCIHRCNVSTDSTWEMNIAGILGYIWSSAWSWLSCVIFFLGMKGKQAQNYKKHPELEATIPFKS